MVGGIGWEPLAARQEGAVGGVQVRHHEHLLPLVIVHLAVVRADARGAVLIHQAAGGAVPADLHRLLVVELHHQPPVLGGQGPEHRGACGTLRRLGFGRGAFFFRPRTTASTTITRTAAAPMPM